MKVNCNQGCHQQYNADAQSNICPHRPLILKECSEHGGNYLQCTSRCGDQKERQAALDVIANEYGALGAVSLNESLEEPEKLCSVLLIAKDEGQLRRILEWAGKEGLFE